MQSGKVRGRRRHVTAGHHRDKDGETKAFTDRARRTRNLPNRKPVEDHRERIEDRKDVS